ncbi:Transcription factor MADS-box [Arabidopsis thaliana x Arabidopsis arenosa]|uniref:Transcription factor MADS-box n=1 Tax=Arabidopsis thaliana x Arabidopsis arenosa TaxID=1240361 RepID=A0A8T2BFE2_9BRAS|nr:Transcription factor MADS-box [Arabidopsis thaliana x Arabidopsis arenosa]
MNMKKKLSLIKNGTSRKTTFNKRKPRLMKKLTELVTLYDVKACAVIHSPYNSNPEAWPSREGVEEVVSEFMEVSRKDRNKKMMDQDAFLRQRIESEQAQLQKLRDENRDLKTREIMWGCLEGDIDVHQLGEKDLQDLSSTIDNYLNCVTNRFENLKKNGESSSSLPPLVVPDLNVEEDADIPSIDGSTHQSETNRLAIITTTAADACAPNITNNPKS